MVYLLEGSFGLKRSTLQNCQWLVLLTLTSLTGCGGCRPDGAEKLTAEELAKRAREQRDSLEMSELLSLPTDSVTKLLTAKPGHWVETRQQYKSNRDDLQVVAVGNVGRGTETAIIPGTDIVNEVTRRTSLPRGQTKTVDLQYFVPNTGKKKDAFDFGNAPSNQLNFRTELLTWPLQTPILQSPDIKPANELREHEFILAVLSPQPLGYSYLKELDAVSWRNDDLLEEEELRSYFVSLVKPENNSYAFPHSMLTMTSVAVVVWDDVSPDELSSEQQAALVDWLHWGGELLISGPSSWSRLQNSFLSPYLPATSAEAVEFESVDFAKLSSTWTTQDRTAPNKNESWEILGPKIGGLRFQLGAGGQWLPGSGELVAESQVGRGRIAVTAFPLREPRIYRWKYFSSFLSTGLLRRPPRTFAANVNTRVWQQMWAQPLDGMERDPRLHSNLRLLSRDLPLGKTNIESFPQSAAPQTPPSSPDESINALILGQTYDEAYEPKSAPPLDPRPPQWLPKPSGAAQEFNTPAGVAEVAQTFGAADFEAVRWGGAAAWSDTSGLSQEALSTLKAAAGIELPTRSTILYLLAGYLVCLVPLNWLIFKMLGRLEFAWLAAPILAVVGVAVVTRVASLDIGFARRTTELSMLELHGGYSRGHLTQFIALYTSLSTNYAVELPENGSVVLPMGDFARARRRAAATLRTVRSNYGRSSGVTLEPLTVYSNSTEMLHAEQVVGLSGGIVLGQSSSGQPAVKNETGLPLHACVVLHCPTAGAIEFCWAGELGLGKAFPLKFSPIINNNLWGHWQSRTSTQATLSETVASGGDSLWIGGLLHELARKTPLLPGQMRLIGYTDERPGDLEVVPAEDQFDGRCVVVAHLNPPPLGPIQPDRWILSRPADMRTMPLEGELND